MTLHQGLILVLIDLEILFIFTDIIKRMVKSTGFQYFKLKPVENSPFVFNSSFIIMVILSRSKSCIRWKLLTITYHRILEDLLLRLSWWRLDVYRFNPHRKTRLVGVIQKKSMALVFPGLICRSILERVEGKPAFSVLLCKFTGLICRSILEGKRRESPRLVGYFVIFSY